MHSIHTMSNQTLYRYELNPTAQENVLELPKGASIVNAGPDLMRGGMPAVWALVDPEAPKEKRAIISLQTGAPAPYDAADLNFIGAGIVAGKSKSQPGQMTPRTATFFEATGDTAEGIIATADLLTED